MIVAYGRVSTVFLDYSYSHELQNILKLQLGASAFLLALKPADPLFSHSHQPVIERLRTNFPPQCGHLPVARISSLALRIAARRSVTLLTFAMSSLPFGVSFFTSGILCSSPAVSRVILLFSSLALFRRGLVYSPGMSGKRSPPVPTMSHLSSTLVQPGIVLQPRDSPVSQLPTGLLGACCSFLPP